MKLLCQFSIFHIEKVKSARCFAVGSSPALAAGGPAANFVIRGEVSALLGLRPWRLAHSDRVSQADVWTNSRLNALLIKQGVRGPREGDCRVG
jgi:hypothetical protein